MELFLAAAPEMADEERMNRFAVLLLAGEALCRAAWAGGDLTAMETRWLEAGWPVLQHAQAQQLPLDVVVQPQATPGHAPLAMGFVDGRCKLVLSMRGNPAAGEALAAMPHELQALLIEAITAHEIGHCWRYVQGAWHALPAGFAEAPLPDAADDLQRDLRAMQRTRREEGFADLVGLAWTLRHHPDRYAEVHAWFVQYRGQPALPGSHHDTLAWLRLATERAAFEPSATLFEQAMTPWRRGLESRD